MQLCTFLLKVVVRLFFRNRREAALFVTFFCWVLKARLWVGASGSMCTLLYRRASRCPLVNRNKLRVVFDAYVLLSFMSFFSPIQDVCFGLRVQMWRHMQKHALVIEENPCLDLPCRLSNFCTVNESRKKTKLGITNFAVADITRYYRKWCMLMPTRSDMRWRVQYFAPMRGSSSYCTVCDPATFSATCIGALEGIFTYSLIQSTLA